MAGSSTTASGSFVYERRVAKLHKYRWPAVQLNIWMLVMLVASALVVGTFATFLQIQQQLNLYSPWYFIYFIIVGALTIVYLGILLWLIANRRLLPSIVIIGSLMFFVLWLVGLIFVGMELFGPSGSVSSNCDVLVYFQTPTPGNNQANLAWLQQRSICQTWRAIFSFALIGVIFLLWIIIIATQVFYSGA